MSTPANEEPKKRNPLPYDSHMVRKIDTMLGRLEKLEDAPATNSQATNEAPGILLEKVKVKLLHTNSSQYKEALWDYQKIRPRFLAGLTQHPVTRSMALLAVGVEGVEQMERGRVPTLPGETFTDSKGKTKQRLDLYNCHHVIQKSVVALDGQHEVNDPYNMVVTQSFTSNGSKQNPHFFWHAVYTTPQIKGKFGTEIDFYAPRPTFPFYPPIREGIQNVAELRDKLNQLEPGAQLPKKWEDRLLAFSQATNHQSYSLTPENSKVTQMHVDTYNPKAFKDKAAMIEHKEQLTQLSGTLATERLPANAWVNGTQLPPTHSPTIKVPLFDSSNISTPIELRSIPNQSLLSNSNTNIKHKEPNPQRSV